MGFTIETGISALTVFVQGLLSFFSPCVLPLVPLYLGYLAGGLNIQPGQGTAGGAGAAGSAENDGGEGEKECGLAGKKRWSRDSVRLFIRMLCFTAGIGGAFFVLGLGASALGTFFQEQRRLFAGIGGILVMLFGLYQLGVFGSSRILGEKHRIPLHLDKLTMSPVTAFVVGFGSVQEAYESGKIHGEGGRRPYDPDGPAHVYGKDERYHRISVHKYAGVCR